MKSELIVAAIIVAIILLAVWRCVKLRENFERQRGHAAVVGCPWDSAKCMKNYFMCINTCGPDLTIRSAPRCIRKCKWEAVDCRKGFLDCLNAKGALAVT